MSYTTVTKRRDKKAMATKDRRPMKAGQDPGFKPREVKPRTFNQSKYLQSIQQNQITFVSGPAGTGKTHVAIGAAVKLLKTRQIEKIILSRPLVGIGKDMGFFPGDVDEKITPYLIPFYDELNYYLSHSMLQQLKREGVIEAVPPCLLRGRTFNDAFIIMDECQNASHMELKTLLTRFGEYSKVVLAGDLIQSDLYDFDQGAFKFCIDKLYDLGGVGHVPLTSEDIIRARLISDIIERLENGAGEIASGSSF